MYKNNTGRNNTKSLLLPSGRLKNDPYSWEADRKCEGRSPSDKLNPAKSFITEYDRWESETSTSEIMGHDKKNKKKQESSTKAGAKAKQTAWS